MEEVLGQGCCPVRAEVVRAEARKAWHTECRGETDQRASVARVHRCVMGLSLVGQGRWRALEGF